MPSIGPADVRRTRRRAGRRRPPSRRAIRSLGSRAGTERARNERDSGRRDRSHRTRGADRRPGHDRASSSSSVSAPSIRVSTSGSNAGHHGESGSAPPRDRDGAVDVGAEELAVASDHLAVEPVQRPQAEVAVLGQLGEAGSPLEGAVEQGPDRRGLEEDMGIALERAGRPAASTPRAASRIRALIEHRGRRSAERRRDSF